MRVHGLLPMSFVNGDGIRVVVFLQGCAHHCLGCHNPDSWDFNGGKEMSVETVAGYIRDHMNLKDGLTLSGGDPFYQHNECMKLLDLLPDINVWIYTGFEYDEIKDTPLAKRADVLVTGPYIDTLKCVGKMYGSSNQEIHRRE